MYSAITRTLPSSAGATTTYRQGPTSLYNNEVYYPTFSTLPSFSRSMPTMGRHSTLDDNNIRSGNRVRFTETNYPMQTSCFGDSLAIDRLQVNDFSGQAH